MIRVALFAVLVMIAVTPSALITRWAMARRGQKLRLFEAPREYMRVGPLPAKIALVALNFALFGAIVWFIYWGPELFD